MKTDEHKKTQREILLLQNGNNNTTLENQEEIRLMNTDLPPDIEELDGGDKFFRDLCDLMEEHSKERDIPLEVLIYNMRMFVGEWIMSMYVTGASLEHLWDLET